MNSDRFRLTVATQQIGAPSQTWIGRQLNGFSVADARVMAWQQPADPGIRTLIDLVGSNPEPHAGKGRWRRRLTHVIDGNYFAAQGNDLRMIRDVLQRQKPDVVLSHFGHMGLRLLPVVKELSIPMVVHFHGMDLSVMLQKWFYRTSLRRWGHEFSASIVVGSHQREILRSYVGDLQPIHLIPCGVPTKEFSPLYRNPSDKVTLISVGRLVRDKGPEETIRAFALLDQALPATELVFVGDGPEHSALQNLAKHLGVGNRVTFTGNLDSTGVQNMLQAADVLVHSSFNEGFGVALTEAAAMKLPVIATRSGGIPDQVVDGETGFLIEPGDVTATTEAMTRLILNREERLSMGENGRRRAQERFDTPGQIQKLEAVLQTHARGNARK